MTETRPIGSPDLSDAEFDKIRSLVYDRFGINLTDQKRNLVVGRLQKVLRTRGMSSFSQYVDFMANDPTGEALSELIDRISTNHTFFFREPEHFRFLEKVVLPEACPRLEAKGDRDLRIWSAGCSSGEEPYTISVVLREYFGRNYAQWRAGVLATDISSHVLRHAERGIFPVERLAKTPPELRRRYFRDVDEDRVAVDEEIRREVTFRRFNLMNAVFSFKKPFQVIFCRNVMIYFDAPTRAGLIRRFHSALEPGGYLFIGHSESLGRDDTYFQYVQPAVYRRK